MSWCSSLKQNLYFFCKNAILFSWRDHFFCLCSALFCKPLKMFKIYWWPYERKFSFVKNQVKVENPCYTFFQWKSLTGTKDARLVMACFLLYGGANVWMYPKNVIPVTWGSNYEPNNHVVMVNFIERYWLLSHSHSQNIWN